MRYLYACWLLVGPAVLAGSAGPTLQEARQRWLHGNYEEARALYEALARDPGQKAAAAIGLSRAWQSQGEYDKALAAIDSALQERSRNAALHARRAELLHLRGRWEDAAVISVIVIFVTTGAAFLARLCGIRLGMRA